MLNIRVPAGAEVWFGDLKMALTGREYTYDIRARWTDANGQVVEHTRQAAVHAGDVINLDLTKPAPAPAR